MPVRRFTTVSAPPGAAPGLPDGLTLEKWEDEIIREALRRAGGNKSQAARALGLSRNALRYRLSKIGVPPRTRALLPLESSD
jgi:DNA-binding NtrC family response regulator